jgi:hypothetical protein
MSLGNKLFRVKMLLMWLTMTHIKIMNIIVRATMMTLKKRTKHQKSRMIVCLP